MAGTTVSLSKNQANQPSTLAAAHRAQQEHKDTMRNTAPMGYLCGFAIQKDTDLYEDHVKNGPNDWRHC
ncbi:UNVERIFIED_CONTAM: hypothetical protein FKN15_031980 [Acipenser sinensis]